MRKITKKLLLEKGTPKCSNLGQIKKINLSNLNLKTSDFDRKLFSQLRTLEELDVSGNRLTEFPNNLGLSNLRLLNCANNELEQITTLNQFRNLEDLNCEDNLYLTISDIYKVMYLLPNLRQLDGKDITSTANNLKFVNSQKLMSQVTNFWEKYCKIQFSELLPTAAEISAIKKDFVKSAVAEIKYGPNSLKEFTKWRMKTIATEFVNSLLQQDQQRSSDAEENEDEEELKANLTDQSSVTISSTRSARLFTARDTTKSRKQVISEVSKKDTEDISRRSMKIQLGKERQSAQMAKYPNKASRVDVKTEPSTMKRDHSATPVVSEETIPRKRPKYKKTLVLEPLHFLQSHSRDNNPEDLSTQLWDCAFEPEIKNSQIPGLVSSQSVATCGGDSVCIIDCETGIVRHKYKSVGEEFFSLAWTTLTVFDKNQKRKFNVLAAGGKMGVVKLMHVKVSYCYGMIKAHKKAISILYFSPKHETFLFTGSYDKTIILWDIGVPDNDYNFSVSRLLVLKVCSTPLKMSLVPTFPDQYLVAACEGGCFAWDISLTNYDSKRNIKMEFLFPVCNKESGNPDSLAFCNDDLVASKGIKQGSIYLWSWSQTLKRWNKRQTKIHAVILREVEWSNTEEVYIALTVSPVENYLLCGDEKGDIWMYDLDGITDEEMTSGKKTPPTQILKWPAMKSQGETIEGTLINNVTTDPECNYLVAVTDKNIVVIWKRT
ncbi:leucine-rich repeat and WD repeat-containing protein 1 isoform X1 [Hemiscyllium ocellatum]|uniref:leucine-rich repeat and WD repeat-containing protein 1 isoform X1 n=1 Tax=Hemiscyllium ocellatum TaxID=170820 RepID=UPI0029666CCB|nr:leucine-rich repeat and WD repeat-containing protein 1 isoform X1 [Hemiscyllium ocellatum]XP_060704128.1 leucine-rich repeat and WD repeat-containing protein 1 isoform X1 [Hemiscyllium ocellatum]XP_060704129.1 leucine-rich repeat and WD repeat-containing protein 1 isoform X1 [Hemiscyllium ocellatum]